VRANVGFSPQRAQRKHRGLPHTTRNGSVDTGRMAVPIVVELASRFAPRRWGGDVAEPSTRPRWPARAAANQPDHATRSAGRGLGAAQRGCGGGAGGAPLTLGGKMESASAGSGKRAGDGPFALTQLLSLPGYGSPARRAAAQGTSKVPVSSSLFAATPEEGGGPASAADWTSRWPNARPSTCFEALYEPKRITWSHGGPHPVEEVGRRPAEFLA
jgi:hypothetical protein